MQKRLGEILTDTGMVSRSKIQSALVEQDKAKQIQQVRELKVGSTVRVPSERLDKLVDLVGELVTVQARLSQTASTRNDAELICLAEEVEGLTAELRDNAMSTRMVPIGNTFRKFRRLVRDLSQELGKEIELVTQGEETELDKTVIEKLNDPLVHLIRNSVDHGIEPSSTRQALGKPSVGTLRLTANHSGASVIIQIIDDGAGLDADAIRKKAIERGLISEESHLSDKDAFQLIFAPGFSTAKTVTGVSGRGVGMDVVKKNIEQLGGSIDLHSHKNEGTTINLKLPLTLAIIDGLLVKVGQNYFVLPLAMVEECVEVTHAEMNKIEGRSTLNVRGHLIPYIRLRDVFKINGQIPSLQHIVITEEDGQRIGLAVDHVIGSRQTVIKSLGRIFKNARDISGATILGDGTVALILDINSLIFRNVDNAKIE